MQPAPLPATLLQEALQSRIARNPAYSLRALARDLGISHTFLSLVMSGKKSLSVERASQIAELLRFTRAETRRFVQAVVISSPAKRGGYAFLRGVLGEGESAKPRRAVEFFDLDQDRFRAIAGWWHPAILDLMTCDDARSDHAWIAKRLGLSRVAVRDAVERLLRLGLLEERDGRWVKTQQHLLTSLKKPDTMMRLFHKDMIAKGLVTVSEQTSAEDFARRDLLSMTVAINPARLERAREIITEFQERIVACLTEGPCTEVYQLNYQLLPLTRQRKEGA